MKLHFNTLVLTERGGWHGSYTDAGLKWLEEEAKTLNFEFTEINDTKPITKDFLSEYQLIIQLDYLPYNWTEEARAAFIDYIDNGRGGWIGFHHAALLGEFDGYPMWNWFSAFLGDIRFKFYIEPLAEGRVIVEDKLHPIMQGVDNAFLATDEWYIFDRSPRPNVRVLASVDENSYRPASDVKMGDHPAVWVNESKKAKNVYFLMGHNDTLFKNKNFTTMFRNAIRWASDPSLRHEPLTGNYR